MRHCAIAAVALSAVTLATAARAQDTVFIPSPSHVAIRTMRSVPVVDLTNRLHAHTVIGATGSVSLVDFDSGGVAPLHHHTREQIDVGLVGTFQMTIGTHPESLLPSGGIVVPEDVNHLFANPGPGVATLIEFHTVRRVDVVPPRPRISFPVAAVAATMPDDQYLAARLDTPSGTALSCHTCSVAWRWIDSSIDVHPGPTPTELFVYVAQGTAELVADGRTTNVPAGSLVVVPAALAHARIRPIGGSRTGLIEFQVRQ